MSSTALHHNQFDIWLAAKMGVLQRVQYLVSQDIHCINETDQYNNTPIYYAAYAGHYEVVYFLLKHGAVYDDRTILSALNIEIQRLLRIGKTFSNSSSSSFPSPKPSNAFQSEGIEKVFENLYENHVRRERILISHKNFFLREDYSDFSIIITDEHSKFSEIFHVHLLVLVNRWKKFRREYVVKITQHFLKELETKSECMDQEEKTIFWRSAFREKMLQIDENILQLKGKKMNLAGIDPELFHALLKYLYTLNFQNSIKRYLDTKLETESLEMIIPKVLQTIKSLGLTDILQPEIYYYCKQIKPNFEIDKSNKDQSYMSWKNFDFVKRGKDEIQQALKFINAKWNPEVKYWYDMLDRTVRIMCCKACSDIILYTLDQTQQSEFYCHKAVLVHSNHYFRTLLLGNFVEAEQLNDDSNVQFVARLGIEPAFPNSLKIVLEHIYFKQLIDFKAHSKQDLINTLIMAQKYDEIQLVEKISDALTLKAEYGTIFRLYAIASNLSVYNLMHSLEKRMEMFYNSSTKFDFRSASLIVGELQNINALHLIATVEMRGIEYMRKTKFLPLNTTFFKHQSIIDRVEQIVQRKWYRILNSEATDEEEGQSKDSFLNKECPFCNQNSCTFSSMFSHFAFYCPAFEALRNKLVVYSRDRLRSAVQEICLPSDKVFWEPWFLPFSIHLLEIDTVVTTPIRCKSKFKIMKKELGILGFVPCDYSKKLQRYYNADLLYQKQVDRIQKYITTTYLPDLFTEIDTKLCITRNE